MTHLCACFFFFLLFFVWICIIQLFQRALVQYDRLKKHNAFIDNYKKQPMFADGLEEFDDAREVVQSMVEEYKASEKADYATWGRAAAP